MLPPLTANWNNEPIRRTCNFSPAKNDDKIRQNAYCTDTEKQTLQSCTNNNNNTCNFIQFFSSLFNFPFANFCSAFRCSAPNEKHFCYSSNVKHFLWSLCIFLFDSHASSEKQRIFDWQFCFCSPLAMKREFQIKKLCFDIAFESFCPLTLVRCLSLRICVSIHPTRLKRISNQRIDVAIFCARFHS